MSEFESDIIKDALKAASGTYGTVRIAGTNAVTGNFMGLFAREDTVIAALSNNTHDIGIVSGYAGKTVFAGQEVWFGTNVTSITLTSGSAEAYSSRSLLLPNIPQLLSYIPTAANGTTITCTFSEVMSNPASYAANFVVKVAGSAVPLTSVALGTNTKQIVITPQTPIAHGDVVTLTMQSTNIKSAAGAYFAGVANAPVTNLVP